jgi:hypothetical protein
LYGFDGDRMTAAAIRRRPAPSIAAIAYTEALNQ